MPRWQGQNEVITVVSLHNFFPSCFHACRTATRTLAAQRKRLRDAER
ncbi:hypothetical protein GWL_10780 [Herbaspirillum sp. GW103]|nr:hypothetical protein GWL_10780 [Herbaspirillum sp. GW103]